MTRDEILNAIQQSHTDFLAVIADIPDEGMTRDRVMDW